MNSLRHKRLFGGLLAAVSCSHLGARQASAGLGPAQGKIGSVSQIERASRQMPAYAATLVATEGTSKRWAWLLVSGGSYRLGKHYNQSYGERPPTWFEYHEGGSSIWWEYRVDQRAGTAFPVQGHGARASIWLPPASSLHPPLREWTKSGTGVVAGRTCEGFRYEWRPKPGQLGAPTLQSGRQTLETVREVFVDQHTGLILSDTTISRRVGGGLGIPFRVTVAAQSIRYLRSVPDSQFRLPKGSIAYVPKELAASAIPAGVVRKVIGVDVHPKAPKIQRDSQGRIRAQ